MSEKNCTYNDCRKKLYSKEYCKMHQYRLDRNGSLELKTKKEVLLSRVTVVGDCWIYNGYINHYGYGRLRYDSKKILAHRLSYELHIGSVPSEMMVIHKCDHPACINPDHLKIGTHIENQSDRKTSYILQKENHDKTLVIERLEKEKVILKGAIQKMLNGIDFALDEAFSRKTVSARLRECRSEAIKFLVAKTK